VVGDFSAEMPGPKVKTAIHAMVSQGMILVDGGDLSPSALKMVCMKAKK
jgi:hypothetical protein